MPYREKLMANAKKWGEEIFASSIRILEAEYQKVERRNEAGQIFTDLFAQWEEFTKEKAACLGICYLDMTMLMKKLRNEHPRIYPYEEDAVRIWYAEYYYAALEVLCRDMQKELKEYEAFQRMNKTEDFYMFFGRWRGEAEKLLCIETI